MRKIYYILIFICVLLFSKNVYSGIFERSLTDRISLVTKPLLRSVASGNSELALPLESSINSGLVKPVLITAALANEELFSAFGRDIQYSGADITGLNSFKSILDIGDNLMLEDGRITFNEQIEAVSSLFEHVLTDVSKQGNKEALLAAYTLLVYPPMETSLWVLDHSRESLARRLEWLASMSILLEKTTDPHNYSDKIRPSIIEELSSVNENGFATEDVEIGEIMMVAGNWLSQAIDNDITMNGTQATYRDLMHGTVSNYIAIVFRLFNEMKKGQIRSLEQEFSVIVENVAKVARNYRWIPSSDAQEIILHPLVWLKVNAPKYRIPDSAWYKNKRKF